MIFTTPSGHSIEFFNNILGLETVKYNGQVVSQKRTMFGGLHTFQVMEEGEQISYEIEVKTRWHGLGYYFNVRRNGVLFFNNK